MKFHSKSPISVQVGDWLLSKPRSQFAGIDSFESTLELLTTRSEFDVDLLYTQLMKDSDSPIRLIDQVFKFFLPEFQLDRRAAILFSIVKVDIGAVTLWATLIQSIAFHAGRNSFSFQEMADLMSIGWPSMRTLAEVLVEQQVPDEKGNRNLLESLSSWKMPIATELVDGRIPPNQECPYREICEIKKGGGCRHEGVNHNMAYSCAAARAFQIMSRPKA